MKVHPLKISDLSSLERVRDNTSPQNIILSTKNLNKNSQSTIHPSPSLPSKAIKLIMQSKTNKREIVVEPLEPSALSDQRKQRLNKALSPTTKKLKEYQIAEQSYRPKLTPQKPNSQEISHDTDKIRLLTSIPPQLRLIITTLMLENLLAIFLEPLRNLSSNQRKIYNYICK